jgi:uncharacterized protein (TIGR02594 family)
LTWLLSPKHRFQTMLIDDYTIVRTAVETHRNLLSYQWMQTALRYFGVAEINGELSDPLIIQFIATATGRRYRTEHSPLLPHVSPESRLPLVCSGFRFRRINDSTPWCSAFVNHVMITSGFGGTGRLGARSWSHWGQRLPEAQVRFGAIAVFRRHDPNNANAGHVGFYYGEDEQEYHILSGNQSLRGEENNGRVCVKGYPKSNLLSFRWPNVSG